MTQALVADAWLGDLLGRPAFHLSPDADPAAPVAGPAFVDAKVPTADIRRAHALSGASYRFIDTNVQLDRATGTLPVPKAHPEIRAAVSEDAEGVQSVAGDSFCFDRFHADPGIPDTVADRIKSAWAGNYFTGTRGNRMIVAADGVSVLGFLQIIDRPDVSIIDLIAVAPGAQGRGLATAMIVHAVASGRSVPWRVGTQIANVPSLRLYERLGFRVSSSQYVFHRHVD